LADPLAPKPEGPAAPPQAAAPAGTEVATASMNAAPVAGEDRIEVAMEGKIPVVNVYRSKGIGGIAVTAPKSGWPSVVLVRFHGFPALERLTAKSGSARLACELQRREGRMAEQICTLNGGRVDALRRVGDIYEVTLPNSLLASAAEPIEVRWVDQWR
jgi:hypothetical protein